MTRTIKLNNSPSLVEVNESSSLVDMQRNCPMFFNFPFGKRETYTVHRGCLICRHTTTFSDGKPVRRTVVYLYLPAGYSDSPRPDMYCVSASGEVHSIKQGKRLIDKILDGGSYWYGM